MASRRVAKTHAPKNSSKNSAAPYVFIGVGAIALGSAAWMWARPAQASSPPVLPGPTPTNPVPGPQPTQTDYERVVSRLRTSDVARQIYGFQAELYSSRFTDAKPDGAVGPITTGLIREVQRLAGKRITGSFTPDLINTTTAALAAWPENPHSLRVIPDALPATVMNLVNSTIRRFSPSAPLLQMNATA